MHEITYFSEGAERFYTCSECSKGAVRQLFTLETGIEHVVKHQFIVAEKKLDDSNPELGITSNPREYSKVLREVRPRRY